MPRILLKLSVLSCEKSQSIPASNYLDNIGIEQFLKCTNETSKRTFFCFHCPYVGMPQRDGVRATLHQKEMKKKQSIYRFYTFPPLRRHKEKELELNREVNHPIQ